MKISVITPSLNQGEYIERTIRSVLRQTGDFELEYIIIDGGSTDHTAEIVKKYSDQLTFISEKDNGQVDAINKGFTMATGDILAWLNSDDTYEKDALNIVAETYKKNKFKWCFGYCRNIDRNDREIRKLITLYKKMESWKYSYSNLLSKNFIPQPAVFFTREAFLETGLLDEHYAYSMDYDYWLRLGRNDDPLIINSYCANFRWHNQSKCANGYRKAAREALHAARQSAGRIHTYSLFRHYLHYRTLSVLYRIL